MCNPIIPRPPHARNTPTIQPTDTGYSVTLAGQTHQVDLDSSDDGDNIISCSCDGRWILDAERCAKMFCEHITAVRRHRDARWSQRPANLPVCPECGALCSYQGSSAHVRCLSCPWSVTLSPEQNADMLDAVAGLSELPLDLFLVQVNLAAGAAREERAA